MVYDSKEGDKAFLIIITDDDIPKETHYNEKNKSIMITKGYDNFDNVINEQIINNNNQTTQWSSF